MMIYENVELHNIAEARPVEGMGGLRLQRVPEAVRVLLEEPAQKQVLAPAGAEIRFVLERGTARITLSSVENTTLVRVFWGPFFSRTHQWEIGSQPVTIELERPEGLSRFPQDRYPPGPFSMDVCRVVLWQGYVHLHGVEGKVRPPREEELPRYRMLSYGTSITHGRAASLFHLSYVAQTAWRLGVDLVNYGVGGACRAEAAFADYLASLDDWHFAVLALSVNMIGAGFSLDEFKKRARYLVEKVAGADSSRPVACISIYPYFGDWGDYQPGAKARPDQFRRALQEVVEELAAANVRFIPGPRILADPTGLTDDLVHPGDLGMISMGENLAARLRPILRVHGLEV